MDPAAEKGKFSRQRTAAWLRLHRGTRVSGYWLEEKESRTVSGRSKGSTYRLHSEDSDPGPRFGGVT
jgi:hypothetical protein